MTDFNPTHTLRGFDRALDDTRPAGFASHLGPNVYRCDGCDGVRQTQRAYCASCAEVTGSYVGRRFGTIERYWNDPVYREEIEVERREHEARMKAIFAPHDAAVRAKQEARWAAEGQS